MHRILCYATKVPFIIYEMVHFLPILMNNLAHEAANGKKTNSIWCVTCAHKSLPLHIHILIGCSGHTHTLPTPSRTHSFQFSLSFIFIILFVFICTQSFSTRRQVEWCHWRWPPFSILAIWFRFHWPASFSICAPLFFLSLLSLPLSLSLLSLPSYIRHLHRASALQFSADSKSLHLLS